LKSLGEKYHAYHTPPTYWVHHCISNLLSVEQSSGLPVYLSCRTQFIHLHNRNGLEVTDDVSIVEHLKHPVYITEGSYTNIKVLNYSSNIQTFMVSILCRITYTRSSI